MSNAERPENPLPDAAPDKAHDSVTLPYWYFRQLQDAWYRVREKPDPQPPPADPNPFFPSPVGGMVKPELTVPKEEFPGWMPRGINKDMHKK